MRTTRLILSAVLSLALAGCETRKDPVTGQAVKKWVGPSISLSLGYNGASASVTLWEGKDEPKALPEAPDIKSPIILTGK